MNLRFAVALLALTAITPAWAQTPAPATAPATATAPASAFKTDKEKVGYAIGVQFGERISDGLKDVEFDSATLIQGLKDTITGGKPQMSDQEIIDTLSALQKKLQAKAAAEEAKATADDAKIGEINQKAGDAFLADNAKKDGVKTTASGLQYKVLKSGAGKSPKATDTVSVHYKGTLISGKQFDASGDKAVTFPLDGVIKGWTEGLQLMKVGDTFQFVIPAKLAYGDRPPRGAPIGPNEVLVFEVELLEVK